MALDKDIPISDEVLAASKPSAPFSGFSVNDLDKARTFYRDVLGLRVVDSPMGLLNLCFSNGSLVIVYPKPNHEPATFTVLNFPVGDLGAEVDRLASLGVEFLRYDGFGQDERGIAPGGSNGPDIAWFTDPAGNILSVLQA